ncbi:MAG: AEC family transporter [Rickettsiaceae bacterium]|nr:MAG: AEC family transporter [Rickettsiaceae bacterium]
MQNIFSSILPIFLVTLLGSIIKRKWLTSDEFWRGLEKLSYFLLFPAVLFNYISKADLSSTTLIKLVIALAIATLVVAAGLIINRKKKDHDKIQFTSTFQGAIRYNTYVFFGAGSALFGEAGLAIISVISSYMIVFTNIICVMVFATYIPSNNLENNKVKNFFLITKLITSNPLIISTLIGFLFNYYHLSLHLGVENAISSLSNSALAIGMLNVGAGLQFDINADRMKQVIFTSTIKLVILPIVTVIIMTLMSITGLERSIGVLYSCLPCASSAYALSRQLNGDPQSMASIITITTVFSVISLSLVMYVLC